MTTSTHASLPNPARWAPDPEVRGRLRYWDGVRWTVHTVDPVAPSRPDLPTWFRTATWWLYAGCGLLGATNLALAVLGLTASTENEVWLALTGLVLPGVTLLMFVAGAWGWTVASSRRVDRTALHRDPVWFLVAWLVPILHVVFPHQLFGEVWASARNVRTRQDPSVDTTSLATAKPWVMGAWAWAWAIASGGWLLLALLGVPGDAVILTIQVASGASALLLLAVLRAIAREVSHHHGGW